MGNILQTNDNKKIKRKSRRNNIENHKILYIIPNKNKILYLYLYDKSKTTIYCGRDKIKDHAQDNVSLSHYLSDHKYLEIPLSDKIFNSMLELRYNVNIKDENILDFLKLYKLEEWGI